MRKHEQIADPKLPISYLRMPLSIIKVSPQMIHNNNHKFSPEIRKFTLIK